MRAAPSRGEALTARAKPQPRMRVRVKAPERGEPPRYKKCALTWCAKRARCFVLPLRHVRRTIGKQKRSM